MRAHLQPLLFLLRQHVWVYHLRLDGHTRQALETKPDVSVELVFGLNVKLAPRRLSEPERTYRDTLHEQRRLNTHTPMPGLICHIRQQRLLLDEELQLTKARLIGDDMTWDKRDVAREAVWPFVHVEK